MAEAGAEPLEFFNLPNDASASGCVVDQRCDLPSGCG